METETMFGPVMTEFQRQLNEQETAFFGKRMRPMVPKGLPLRLFNVALEASQGYGVFQMDDLSHTDLPSSGFDVDEIVDAINELEKRAIIYMVDLGHRAIWVFVRHPFIAEALQYLASDPKIVRLNPHIVLFRDTIIARDRHVAAMTSANRTSERADSLRLVAV
jgi:hypothetical protein